MVGLIGDAPGSWCPEDERRKLVPTPEPQNHPEANSTPSLRGGASSLEAPSMQLAATKIITRKTTRFGGAAGMRAI
jgi:hypothetical protein